MEHPAGAGYVSDPIFRILGLLNHEGLPSDSVGWMGWASTHPQATPPGGALRKTLITLAMALRDVRYKEGGKTPSTGFDCSGFVRYVFSHAIGLDLPHNSRAQFQTGVKVQRADLRPGDLVFFHTRGSKRVSHVGIYLNNGHFIHSPSAGKSVQVSSLNEVYWAHRFVGARRPKGLVQNG